MCSLVCGCYRREGQRYHMIYARARDEKIRVKKSIRLWLPLNKSTYLQRTCVFCMQIEIYIYNNTYICNDRSMLRVSPSSRGPLMTNAHRVSRQQFDLKLHCIIHCINSLDFLLKVG